LGTHKIWILQMKHQNHFSWRLYIAGALIFYSVQFVGLLQSKLFHQG